MKTALIREDGPERRNSGVPSPIRFAGHCEIALRKGQVYRWEGDRRGLTVTADEGILWITQENDPSDIVLGPGESFRVDRPGRILVQSLAPTSRISAE